MIANKEINFFVKKNNLKNVIYALNGEVYNYTSNYPESYYLFEDNNEVSTLYDVYRDNKKKLFSGNKDITFTLFLIKVFFIDFSNNNNINTEIYNIEKQYISNEGKEIYYSNYKYYTVSNEEDIEKEKERLNRRVCYLNIFLKELEKCNVIENKIDKTELLKNLN